MVLELADEDGYIGRLSLSDGEKAPWSSSAAAALRALFGSQ